MNTAVSSPIPGGTNQGNPVLGMHRQNNVCEYGDNIDK